MIKFGIELIDKNFTGIDLTKLKNGNPGIGGSEYLFALLGMYLQENTSDIDCTIYHYSDNKLCNKDVIVSDEIEMLHKMEEDHIDIFIYQVNKSVEWYSELEKTNLKAMAWAHVYLAYYEQRLLINNSKVKRVVFVGKEEYDSYIDSNLIQKSTYIYNMLNTKKKNVTRNISSKSVTYVGSLVPAKGFHKLAKIWNSIHKKVPDAELYVIGTGKVYNRNASLGKYGIAQADYENKFMKYLTDANGEIIPAVHFLGLLGEEKDDIFLKTMVGVVNPTALTETFCMSAVEMELMKIPVISRKKWGLLDTVVNGETGYLFCTEKTFKKQIVKLLNNVDLNKKMGDAGADFVKNKFEADNVVSRWIEEIKDVYSDIPTQYFKVQGNYFNDNKWIKQIIRFIRFSLGISWFPDFETIKNIGKKLKRR